VFEITKDRSAKLLATKVRTVAKLIVANRCMLTNGLVETRLTKA